MTIVTSYDSPDIDGVACMIAYTELLSASGTPAKAVYYGDPSLEVKFVKQYTGYFPVEKHSGEYDSNDRFILLDTADPEAIEPAIPPEHVVELFDHRELVFTEQFVNAKKTIELVGSCATLIVERLRKQQVIPSPNAAVYLYSAIVSNTVNFKNSVTTARDRDTADYLKTLVDLPDDYVERMFRSKSNISAENLYEVISQDISIKTIDGKRVSVAQIEIIDLEPTLDRLKEQFMGVLNRLKKEGNIDYFFFSGIDLFKGYNILLTIDEKSEKVLSEALGIPRQSEYKTDSILMRKQLWPKIEAVLRKLDK